MENENIDDLNPNEELKPNEEIQPDDANAKAKQKPLRQNAEDKALKLELEKYKKMVEDLETKALAEKEDFKSLAERRLEERNALKEELDKTQKAFQNELKYQAVREAASKAGLRNMKDLDLINLEDIPVEVTDQGRMILHGIEDFISDLKADRPHWFQDKSAPKFNSGGAGGGIEKPQELTAQKLVLLERKLRAEGKLKEIKDLYETYRKQKKA